MLPICASFSERGPGKLWALGWAWWISIKGWPLPDEGNVNSCSPKTALALLDSRVLWACPLLRHYEVPFQHDEDKNLLALREKPQMLIQLSGVHLLCSLKNNDVAFLRDFKRTSEAAEWQGQRLNTSLPPEQVQEQQQLPPHSPRRSLLEFAIPCDVELLPGEVAAWKV